MTTPPPFERFLEANRDIVMRFLLVAVGPDDADDVFQETFLAALRAYPRVVDDGRLDRWVLRIASRKAIDHHRRTTARPSPTQELPDRPAAETDERDEELWEAVAALPPRQRVAVVLRFVLDRTYDEIGRSMGCTPATARAHVHQATTTLKGRVTWTD